MDMPIPRPAVNSLAKVSLLLLLLPVLLLGASFEVPEAGCRVGNCCLLVPDGVVCGGTAMEGSFLKACRHSGRHSHGQVELLNDPGKRRAPVRWQCPWGSPPPPGGGALSMPLAARVAVPCHKLLPYVPAPARTYPMRC